MHGRRVARIPRARRQIYRGHGTRDIGDVYECLAADAERTLRRLDPALILLGAAARVYENS